MVQKKKAVEDPIKEYGEREIKDNLIPMDEGDVARAVDVPVRVNLSNVETIEKRGDKIKKTRKKLTKKKAVKKSSTNWTEQFKIPGNKKLKDKGPIMII